MATCKQCGADIEVVAGHRAKEYCGDACRMAWRRGNPNTEQSEQDNPNMVEDAVVGLAQPTNAMLASAGFIGRWPTGERTAATAAMPDSGLESRMQQMRGDWWVTPEYAEVVFRRVTACSSKS
jgi:hypothetical protein